ncbi:MAG: DUF4249 domain-containing protein [Crocinitomicaceae bacterium]|jgi:hypothetical protein|nr:DUF4249 domain-containing protein [Crocinitomicaceae bacterium]
MKKLFALMSVIVALQACQKEIDLQLKDADPQYVIRAEVLANDSVHTVVVTKSVRFDQSNEFPTVSGAEIVLSDNFGNSTTLLEVAPGEYKTVDFKAFEGREYTVVVKHEGNTFTAKCPMPFQVQLDSLAYIPNEFFGETGFLIVPLYQDPADVTNFYSFKYRNFHFPELETGLILRDDEVTNGQVSQQPLFEGFTVDSGDTIVLEMANISNVMYKYYFSKEANLNPNSGAPANPVTNWDNNALGYFTARTLSRSTVIIP